MKTLHTSIRTGLAALFAVAAVAAFGCNQGREGDRCNPSLNTNGHDECGGGLTCNANIPFCPEAYCCPTESDGGVGKSSNPNCQPGCNGGAASICNQDAGATGACALACTMDPGDLTNSSVCTPADGGAEGGGGGDGGDGGGDSGSARDTGTTDTGSAADSASDSRASDGGTEAAGD